MRVADVFPGDLDDVVDASDEPQRPVGIGGDEVAGGEPGAVRGLAKHSGGRRFVVEVAGEQVDARRAEDP